MISNDANQEVVLFHSLIKSSRSSSTHFDDFFLLFNGNEVMPPIYITPQDGLKKLDKIDGLLGLPKDINFDQYVGYVTVEPQHRRALFYQLS